LTKDIIRNHFAELYKFRDNTYYRNTSGGSTGEPVIFYQDRDYFTWNTAAKIFFYEWAGRKIGEPMVKLWGALRDILRSGQGFTGYLRQQLSGVTTLSSSRMAEKDMRKYVQRINKIKPCLIFAYTNSIDEFAHFIQEHHLSIYSPQAIMTSAGVLYPEVRARIERVFRAPVFNRYGSREVGDIACNCGQSIGLHIIPDIHYLEILDDKGKEVKLGESGNIIVTSLTNYTMPLIRYKIGDRGILSDEDGKCGHGLPLVEKVVGRITGNFKNKLGDYISGGLFFSLFYFIENIKQFQIVQEAIEYISIHLVLIDKAKLKDMDKDFEEINQVIWKAMGNKTKIKYNIVDEIKPSPSGKHLYSYSKILN
jgi:phenylacetate-CoA ligase